MPKCFFFETQTQSSTDGQHIWDFSGVWSLHHHGIPWDSMGFFAKHGTKKSPIFNGGCSHPLWVNPRDLTMAQQINRNSSHSSPRWAPPPGFKHLALQLLPLGQQVLGTLAEALSCFQHVLKGKPRESWGAVRQPWYHGTSWVYLSSVLLSSTFIPYIYNGWSTLINIAGDSQFGSSWMFGQPLLPKGTEANSTGQPLFKRATVGALPFVPCDQK